MGNTERLWQEVMDMKNEENVTIGPYYSHQIKVDPKALLFTMARYKFATRLLGEQRKYKILELGCNEGLGTNLIGKYSKSVLGVDFYDKSIAIAKNVFGGGYSFQM